jgi:uncharacterized Zn-binding protein involved in type VI secretion
MKKLSRKGDKNDAGGQIVKGADTVFCNNKPVGLHTSNISKHRNNKGKHKRAKTTEGSPTVFADGKPVLRVGSGNTCGHKIVEGSDNVFVP